MPLIDEDGDERECRACHWPAEHEHRNGWAPPQYLCTVCYQTVCSYAALSNEPNSTVLMALAQCTNLILEAIREASEDDESKDEPAAKEGAGR